MSRRGLIALAIVAAAMAGILVFGGRGRQGGEQSAAHVRMMPPFDRTAVRRVVIHRSAGEGITLVHAPSPRAPAPAPAWHLQRDRQPAADDAAVDDLLAALDLAESDRTADISLQAAGLAPPRAEIAIETPNGTPALQLGRADATGHNVYARLAPDGSIRVIGNRVAELADREPDAFRDRRLFPVPPAAATALAWQDPAGAGELHEVEGRWKNGRNEWVGNERVVETLRQLYALRIERFDARKWAVPDGQRTLILTAGATRIALDVGKNGDLLRGDERVHVSPDAFGIAWVFLLSAAARDDRLVAMPPDVVISVQVNDGHRHLGLRRLVGAWAFTTPKVSYTPDAQVVDEWLAQVASARVVPRSGGGKGRHLSVEGRFRQEVDVPASSPPAILALLAADPLRFRERRVLSFARFDVRRLQRTEGKTTQQVTTDDGGGSWKASAGQSADAANASRVVDALADLRAKAFVETPPRGEPAVRLQVDVQPPGEPQPVPHALRIFSAKDGCVATLNEKTTFTLERAACDALLLPLLKSAD
jgi:hypothetical protein